MYQFSNIAELLPFFFFKCHNYFDDGITVEKSKIHFPTFCQQTTRRKLFCWFRTLFSLKITSSVQRRWHQISNICDSLNNITGEVQIQNFSSEILPFWVLGNFSAYRILIIFFGMWKFVLPFKYQKRIHLQVVWNFYWKFLQPV